MAWPQPGNTQAPPNYRKADINPMTVILEEKATLGLFEDAPTVNLTAGTGTFGVIAVATQVTLSYDFDTTGLLSFLGAYIVYTGDNGAFRLDRINTIDSTEALVSGTTIIPVAIPGADTATTLDLRITALAADNGVAKTGTLTFYDRYTLAPFALGRVVETLTLSKTYTP